MSLYQIESDSDELAAVREAEIDRILDTYIEDDTIEERQRQGQERLLDHIDDERILERAREIEAAEQSANAGD